MKLIQEMIALEAKKVKDDEYFITIPDDLPGRKNSFDLYTERAFPSYEAAENFIERQKRNIMDDRDADTDAADEDLEELESAVVMSGASLKGMYPKLFEDSGKFVDLTPDQNRALENEIGDHFGFDVEVDSVTDLGNDSYRAYVSYDDPKTQKARHRGVKFKGFFKTRSVEDFKITESLSEVKLDDMWKKLNKFAEARGEYGFATLDEDDMKMVIYLSKANAIATKTYGEYGFATLDEGDMKKLVNQHPEIVKLVALDRALKDLNEAKNPQRSGQLADKPTTAAEILMKVAKALRALGFTKNSAADTKGVKRQWFIQKKVKYSFDGDSFKQFVKDLGEQLPDEKLKSEVKSWEHGEDHIRGKGFEIATQNVDHYGQVVVSVPKANRAGELYNMGYDI